MLPFMPTFFDNAAVHPDPGEGKGGCVSLVFGVSCAITPFVTKRGLQKTKFVFNTASYGGAAVYATYIATVRICDTFIVGNTAAGPVGGTVKSVGAGGCHITSGAVCDIRDVSYLLVNTGGNGGAIHQRNNATAVDPVVVVNIGGVYLWDTDEAVGAHGGGVTLKNVVNFPAFDRVAYRTAIIKALGTPWFRWPDAFFTRAMAATWIEGIMLWGGITNRQLAF